MTANTFNLIYTLILAVTLGVTGGFLFYQARLILYQIRSTHDWNRRKATHDVLTEIILGSFVGIRRTLEKKIDPYDKSQDYEKKAQELTTDDIQLLGDLLNYLEQMCLAIKHGIIDDDIAFDCASGLLVAYWRWAKPYIDSERVYSPRMWIEIQDRAGIWAEREAKDISSRLVKPGKPAL